MFRARKHRKTSSRSALISSRSCRPLLLVCGLLLGLGAHACQTKLTSAQCAQLLDRYVEFLVKAENPEVSAMRLAQRRREARQLAARSASFQECPRAVSQEAFECALRASNADQLEQCLL